MIDATLGRIAAGEDLALEEMREAINAVMAGDVSEPKIALLLTGLAMKGETATELAGAAMAMRQHMAPIVSSRRGVLDTCGTGGDGSRTFNISTATAIVVAAAGVPVAKHGNRRITSRTGSADVLEHLGVNIDADLARVGQCLDELGICFCFAPLWHGAMRRVSAVRQQLGFPTIFNLLGPLANPAAAEHQLLGVGRPELREKLSGALALLGTGRSLVVCGRDGLDELTLAGPSDVSEVAGSSVSEFTWQPGDFGIEQSGLESLIVDGPAQSASLIRKVLAAEPGPARDIVILNAAAAILISERADSPQAASKLAAEAIDRGAAAGLLERLVERTR